jgi:hypothetical protein
MAIPTNGSRSGALRFISVTMTACGLLTAAALPAQAASAKEVAQPARPHHHKGPHDRPGGKAPVPAVAPPRQHPASEPAERTEGPAEERSSTPDEEEEVSPGEDPASCEGCELAGFALGGTLWGLFGVSRRRGIPRPVIRGLQPR